MPRLTLAFFVAAALYGVGGMVWGDITGAAGDITPAPAHLNLLGWVILSLMGASYAFTGPRAPVRLGWTSFVTSTVGLVTIAFALPKVIEDRGLIAVAISGGLVTFLGLLTFAAAVASHWAPQKAAAA